MQPWTRSVQRICRSDAECGRLCRRWFRTGDIGWLDADGYLTVVDRKKDIVIRSGMNVSPAEIESIMASMPQVAYVAVIAVPTRRRGSGPVPTSARGRIRPPETGEVRHHLGAAGLAKYKWPEEVRVHCGDFPRTPAGKVRKTELRAAWGDPVGMVRGES